MYSVQRFQSSDDVYPKNTATLTTHSFTVVINIVSIGRKKQWKTKADIGRTERSITSGTEQVIQMMIEKSGGGS